MTWRGRRRAGRELVAAARQVGAAFPFPAEDAPDEVWDLYGVVDEMLTAVAGSGRSSFRVAASLAFADAVQQLGALTSALDDDQRAAVDRLQRAVAVAEAS